MTDLLEWKLDEYVYLSQIFNYVRILIALPCAWLIDRFGLRRTIYLALLGALVRNSSRMLLFSPQLSANWREMKFLYWSVCLVSENVVLSIYYSLPLKVSESWFAQRERSLAYTAMVAFPTFGGALASLTLPRLVRTKRSLHWLAALNLFAGLASIVVILSTITKSKPKQAPSQRSRQAERGLALQRDESAGQLARIAANIRNLVGNFNLMTHILATTTFMAMSTAINSLVQDVLAAADLSQTFCGNFLALNGIYGALIQLFSSWYLDRRPRRNRPQQSQPRRSLQMKVFMLLTWLCFILYLGSLSSERLFGPKYQWLLVVGSSLLYGSVWFWTVPFYNDLVADLILVSPVSQATVSASSGAIFVLLNNPYQMLFVYLSAERAHQKTDYSRSMLFAGLVLSGVTLVYVTCFSAPAGQCGDDQTTTTTIVSSLQAAETTNKCRRCRRRRSQSQPAKANHS